MDRQPEIINVSCPTRVSRAAILLAVFRAVAAIPQAVVLTIWGILAEICLILMWIAAVFTARYPEGMFYFVVGYYRKCLQVALYVNVMTERYPPFELGGKSVREAQQPGADR